MALQTKHGVIEQATVLCMPLYYQVPLHDAATGSSCPEGPCESQDGRGSCRCFGPSPFIHCITMSDCSAKDLDLLWHRFLAEVLDRHVFRSGGCEQPVSWIRSRRHRSTRSSLPMSALSGASWYLSSTSPYSLRMRVTWSEAAHAHTRIKTWLLKEPHC